MTVDQLFETDPFALTWAPSTRDVYRTFCDRLMRDGPLSIKIGKGGLSFSKPTPIGLVFICHFNAVPRSGEERLGFADFRKDVLHNRLDLDLVLQNMQHALGPESPIKIGKIWCSMHFPLTRAPEIADIFAEHLIAKVD
ncbi:MAG: hypothetical protein MI924_23355 [Chloroflexales bacterium]|nr:hypothetical protein [Chloroflexales bacterium]